MMDSAKSRFVIPWLAPARISDVRLHIGESEIPGSMLRIAPE